MKEKLQKLRIDHITTSFSFPQSNGRIERLHHTMQDLLVKIVANNEWF